jgi:hypothetical protein
MSLINDALKRAKNTQPNASAPADGPVLRPAFSQRRSPPGSDFLLPAIIVVILLLAVLLLLEWFRGGSEVKVRARTIESVQPASSSEAATAATPQTSVAVVPEKTSAASLPIASNTPASVSVTSSNVSVVVVTPAVPAAPLPLTYKLQSLFYRAKNPSAVINGKTLFIGDRVAEAHVVAIDKDSATIVTAKGETKVLELAQ